eukprot:GFYU01000640.1.p1 GENE.GFYU01000640.1~~GFYU01000640.1.p1  ORF type:complete len:275 (-),score=58.42 GFYU01000640.1:337-1161(-)
MGNRKMSVMKNKYLTACLIVGLSVLIAVTQSTDPGDPAWVDGTVNPSDPANNPPPDLGLADPCVLCYDTFDFMRVLFGGEMPNETEAQFALDACNGITHRHLNTLTLTPEACGTLVDGLMTRAPNDIEEMWRWTDEQLCAEIGIKTDPAHNVQCPAQDPNTVHSPKWQTHQGLCDMCVITSHVYIDRLLDGASPDDPLFADMKNSICAGSQKHFSHLTDWNCDTFWAGLQAGGKDTNSHKLCEEQKACLSTHTKHNRHHHKKKKHHKKKSSRRL